MTRAEIALLVAAVSLVAALLSAIIAALTALRVAWRQHHLTRARDAEAASIGRFAEFFGASHAVSLAIAHLACTSPRKKAAVDAELSSGITDRFNTALAAIRIAEPDEAVEAAEKLDGHLVQVLELARCKRWERTAWWAERADTAKLVAECQVAARSVIDDIRRPVVGSGRSTRFGRR